MIISIRISMCISRILSMIVGMSVSAYKYEVGHELELWYEINRTLQMSRL